MATSVEQEPRTSLPEGLTEIPDTPEVPKSLEQEVKTTPSQFTAQVTDDSGNLLTQTPASKQVTITLPADPAALVDWTKGSPVSALTWFGMFWVRMVKKAAHFGWRVVVKGGSK